MIAIKPSLFEVLFHLKLQSGVAVPPAGERQDVHEERTETASSGVGAKERTTDADTSVELAPRSDPAGLRSRQLALTERALRWVNPSTSPHESGPPSLAFPWDIKGVHNETATATGFSAIRYKWTKNRNSIFSIAHRHTM
jgi:hypothetical protein